MRFSEYIRQSRERLGLTQEKVVEELFAFDKKFEALDVNTYSRWERGASTPGFSRLLATLSFFKSKFNLPFLVLTEKDSESLERDLCSDALKDIIVKSKSLVMNFPLIESEKKDIKIVRLNKSSDLEKKLKLPVMAWKSLTNNFHGLGIEELKKLALIDSNLFVLAEKSEEFFGMMFTLNLKLDVGEAVLDTKKRIKDLQIDDFAKEGEDSFNLFLVFFAYNKVSAEILGVRYLSYLMTKQKSIKKVGGIMVTQEGARNVRDILSLKLFKEIEIDGVKCEAYSSSIEDVLMSKKVIKAFFSEC